MSSDRAALARMLGGYKPSQMIVTGHRQIVTGLSAIQALELDLVRADGAAIRGILTGPAGEWQGVPAVIYCHAHGGRYDIGAQELIDGRPALQPRPFAEALARQGMAAMAIDMPCFGSRASDVETAAAKRHLWHGTTLFGEMLADQAGALDILTAWPGMDPNRVGAFGISMGATLAFWLAALDERLRCVAQLCCFADLGELVRQNGHDRHGIYMSVPGLLKKMRTGQIAGLVAPRPQYAAMGALDPLTPPDAISIAIDDARTAYASAGASERFAAFVDLQAGHAETIEMRESVLAFFSRWLQPEARADRPRGNQGPML